MKIYIDELNCSMANVTTIGSREIRLAYGAVSANARVINGGDPMEEFKRDIRRDPVRRVTNVPLTNEEQIAAIQLMQRIADRLERERAQWQSRLDEMEAALRENDAL